MSRGPVGNTSQQPYSSATPHFFNIILEETLQRNMLQIPHKFIRRCGKTLSDSVFIKLPCGSKWKMKLTKKEGKIWLEKGWPEFAKHYSIKRGSMLIFKYVGKSEFHVVICDTSTAEIDYPSKNIDLELRAPKEEVVEDDYVETLYDFSPSSNFKKREKSSFLPCSQPHNKRIRRTSPTARKGRKSPYITSIEKARIFARVSFESERPFFKTVMQPTYVRAEFFSIPRKFAYRYIKDQGDAVLSVPNGKVWSVQLKMSIQNCGYSVARLCSGWHKFVNGNNLEVGDVCIFELRNGTQISFQVHIVHRTNYEGLQWCEGDYGASSSKPKKETEID
ncbi:B3 domain-containing transcription factor VRN1-like [Humulus lupulus]|uniref:B3 domain-containing transcription factor VRN1-like n=1 Tax=Humulus lupulus TaxID=3486 RepID=UPI002B40DC5E|nr:B3 domain-containing transcription factor VRN1-like [Humulus lupulus]